MPIELPEHLVQLQREADMARQQATTRDYSAEGWKPWLDAVETVQAAVAAYAKETGTPRHEVEQAVKAAARADAAPPPEG
ncbi:hypothetical protein ABZZ17_39590 [Streptomyces sp. NPDC006512]|uniref:hypothetical protein n=1 Tax=Streptomyces sp. NPDC006512 TaxID=3154307 RepID=UPI0033A4E2EA